MVLLRYFFPAFLRQDKVSDGYSRLAWLIWLLTLVLMLIWPIPNGQLPFHRNFILVPLFLLQAWLVWRHAPVRAALPLRQIKPVLVLLGILSVWILLTGLLHGQSTRFFLREFNGKWLRVLETGFMGLSLVPLLSAGRRQRACYEVLWALLCVMGLLAVWQLYDIVRLWHHNGGVIPWQFTRLAYSRFELSVYFSTLLIFLFVEIGVRAALGRRESRVGWPALLVLLSLALAAQLSLMTRNATVGVLANMLSVTLLVLLMRAASWGKGRLLAVALLGVVLIGGVATISWKTDSRWASLKQTLPVALDTSHHLAWLDLNRYPYPSMANGQMVDVSAYERISWLKIGSELMLKEPWGQGLRGDNFHLLVAKYYGPTTTTQSHSGMINFALANGIPGMVLWLVILGWLTAIGLHRFYRYRRAAGLCLAIFVMGMTLRGLVDDIWRDHMLEMFFFFCGLLLTLCYADDEPSSEAETRAPAKL
ncbi:O-antigen ligase family protein [Paludibacterium purpuratum]|uniref:O-antigen ligase-related domain-containing protein n=1 Tax=Paludibacterium purpuratum TaxID=1144873 RepID=A0A4R7BAT0_9NEIS|nr:O-antigen ligase family protein [Paludibacterium purpuratum]TDR80767.1 hypothetical protein DFP86_104267 [Paludibacterium purpuratum]